MNYTILMSTLRLASVAMFALCLACGCERQNSGKISLTYSVFFPPTHFNAVLATEWAKEIEQRSGNEVAITVFTAGSLTKPELCYQGVVDGISDIGMSCFAYTPGRFPVLEGLDLPVGYPDGKTATRVANELTSQYRDLKEISDTHVLYVHAHGPGILASRTPIRSLENMKGLQTRATGLSAKIIRELGGNPIAMSQAETFDALQKRVVDATICPVETLKGWGQGRVVSSVTEVPAIGYTTAMFVVFNKERWNKLPQHIQDIITDVNAEFVEKHAKAWDVADDEGWELVKSLGHEIITLSPEENKIWAEKTSPILDDYVDRTTKAGLPGKQFLDDLQKKLYR